ncbi:MAG: hypothetical protein SOZ76_04255 [Prevotella sp.]|nr:hypothetical protein [Prevotella sp.]
MAQTEVEVQAESVLFIYGRPLELSASPGILMPDAPTVPSVVST